VRRYQESRAGSRTPLQAYVKSTWTELLGETVTPSSSGVDMTDSPQTIVVKNPSSTVHVAFQRAASGDIGDELRQLYGSSSSACRLDAGVSVSCRAFPR